MRARCFSTEEAAPERDVIEYDVVTVGAGPAVSKDTGQGDRKGKGMGCV